MEQKIELKPANSGAPKLVVVDDGDIDMPGLEDCSDDDDGDAATGLEIVLYKSRDASDSDIVFSNGFMLALRLSMDANFRLRRGERYANIDFKPASSFHRVSHQATCALDLRYLRSDTQHGEYFVDGENVERPWSYWVAGQIDGEPIERASALSAARKAPIARAKL
ncbi:hypothetical protein C8R47DRAFT_1205301 [Mycena vitilis]|nr:hypothetical protein C8R47DRAFT_1205301 [Mycena vitilis]